MFASYNFCVLSIEGPRPLNRNRHRSQNVSLARPQQPYLTSSSPDSNLPVKLERAVSTWRSRLPRLFLRPPRPSLLLSRLRVVQPPPIKRVDPPENNPWCSCGFKQKDVAVLFKLRHRNIINFSFYKCSIRYNFFPEEIVSTQGIVKCKKKKNETGPFLQTY